MVFTASDFPALAGGIEVRTSGDAVAHVWSPASQEWRLSQDGDTVSLRSLENGGDPLPRWQKLGKVVLRPGHPLKFTLSGKKKPETDQAKAKDKAKAEPDSKSQGDPKTKDEPAAVPALLVLNPFTSTSGTVNIVSAAIPEPASNISGLTALLILAGVHGVRRLCPFNARLQGLSDRHERAAG